MNNENNEDNREWIRRKRDDEQIGSVRLFLASSMLLAFTLVAAVGIVAWGPLIPEAIAVELGHQTTPFSDYVILHESWHSIAASRRSLSCEQ